MAGVLSLFDSLLVKFIAVFFSICLFVSLGTVIDMMTAALDVSFIHEVSPVWAATDNTQTLINVAYAMCWIPAFIAIAQPILAAVRKEEREEVEYVDTSSMQYYPQEWE